MIHRLSSTTHLLTIDVVEWHRDPAVSSALTANDVAPVEGRTDRVLNVLLDELASVGARATFFVGRSTIASYAGLARHIVRSGHEVGARGEYDGIDWRAFRADARETKASIENATGVQVRGFRSPRTAPLHGLWRFELLVEEGFEFDSSRVAGTQRDQLSPAVPHYAQTLMCPSGTLVEVPLLAAPLTGAMLSVRRLPYATVRHVFETRTRAGLAGVMSFATWEIDEDQPKMRLPVLASLRHYTGRRAARERVARLVREFRFDAIGHRLTELAQDAPTSYAA